MSQDILEKLLENEGIDSFIADNHLSLKKSYSYILGSHLKLLGKPKEQFVLYPAFWEILKLHPEVNSFFYANGGQYYHDLSVPYFKSPVAMKIVSLVIEMLKREFSEEFK